MRSWLGPDHRFQGLADGRRDGFNIAGGIDDPEAFRLAACAREVGRADAFEEIATFAFEPVGIQRRLAIAVMRSLLNRKGLKIVVYQKGLPSDGGTQVLPRLGTILGRMDELYGVRREISDVWIDATWVDGRPVVGPHTVCTLHTSRGARIKAERDLKALEQKRGSDASMRRLEGIAKLLDEALTEDVRS